MTTARQHASRRRGSLIAALAVGVVVLLWWGGALIGALYLFTSGCEDAGVGCRDARPVTAWTELGIALAGGLAGGALLADLLQLSEQGVARRKRIVLLAVTAAGALVGWWLVVRAGR